MTEREALIWLHLSADIGVVRFRRLLEHFGSAAGIIKAGAIAVREVDFRREMSRSEKQGIKIITMLDEGYPALLKQIYDPPLVLYVMGDLQFDTAVGIVGSRRASFYGLSSAQRLAAGLAASGITVISGLARGVDTAAHRGALGSKGNTIAVLGSGLNNIYPPENEELAYSIAGSGAVISEFPLDTGPFPHNFPRRNRIISGLSMGIVVVEAAENSGALITADFALEQGREVFALPGEANSSTSYGTNNLIKQGAKLVTDVEDILEELNLQSYGGMNVRGK